MSYKSYEMFMYSNTQTPKLKFLCMFVSEYILVALLRINHAAYGTTPASEFTDSFIYLLLKGAALCYRHSLFLQIFWWMFCQGVEPMSVAGFDFEHPVTH